MSAPVMGIGKIGTSNMVFRHKMRWTISGEFPSGSFPAMFVKVNARPQLSTDDLTLLNAGKPVRESFTATHYDASEKSLEGIWKIIADCYPPEGVAADDLWWENKQGKLTLELWQYDGTVVERWKMEGVRPTSVNFGDLDFSNSEPCTVEITWQYERVTYENLWPKFPQKVELPTVPITAQNIDQTPQDQQKPD